MTAAVEPVLVETVEAGVVIVRLNRPETRNAMSTPMINALVAALDRIAADPTARAVILTGAGKGFCAGADLEMIKEADPATATIQDITAVLTRAQGIVSALRRMPQPVIAAVNGVAAGGGLSLALACDVRVCAESAGFSAAFVRFGLSGCELGISFTLPKVVGVTTAFEMMLTGRTVDSVEATRLGLVLDAVPDPDLPERALAIARAIAANSPYGVRMTKETMWRNLGARDLEDAMQTEMHRQLLAFRTRDHVEAVQAFMQRRPPAFRNE